MLKTWSPSQDPWGRKLFIQWAFEELLESFLSWVVGVLPLAAMGCGIPSIPLVHCFSVTRRRTCLCPCCCPTPSPKQRGKPARAEVSEHTEFQPQLKYSSSIFSFMMFFLVPRCNQGKSHATKPRSHHDPLVPAVGFVEVACGCVEAGSEQMRLFSTELWPTLCWQSYAV